MNWEKLQKKIVQAKESAIESPVANKKLNLKRKNSFNQDEKQGHTTKVRATINESVAQKLNSNLNKDSNQPDDSGSEVIATLFKEKIPESVRSQYVALDCEMVGLGEGGKQSALARCSVVDFDGQKLYDEFVRPPGFVTDFRTQWSGVRKSDLRRDVAVTLPECQAAVAKLLTDKVLVGHALQNDLKVLLLSHPRRRIRDTAAYRPLMRAHGKNGKFRPRSLKDLCREQLKMTIQGGEHDPGEDARAAMFLYRLHRREWEAGLKAQRNAARVASGAGGASAHMTQQSEATEHEDEQADEDDERKDSNRTESSLKDRMIVDRAKKNFQTSKHDKKPGSSHRSGSGSGMFASCSVDASGRTLPSIDSVASRKKLKK